MVALLFSFDILGTFSTELANRWLRLTIRAVAQNSAFN